jgi:hypothetical protein
MLYKGSHQTHFFTCIDVASKLLEYMIVSQPQLSLAFFRLTLNPPVVDGMINVVPFSVSPFD